MYIKLFGRDNIDLNLNEHKKAVDIANGQIKSFAQNNKVNVSDRQLSFILGAVEEACVTYEEEFKRSYEMVRLFVTLRQGSLKINSVECKSFCDELRGVLLDYLLKKFEEEQKDCLDFYDCWEDDLSMEELLSKIRDGDEGVLKNLLKEERCNVEATLSEKKRAKKSLVRMMCHILHPDYLKIRETLPKNEVCFVYDVLVFAGLQKDDGLTSDDDKYDRIKHLVQKYEYVYTGEGEGEGDEMTDEEREECYMVIGRKYYRYKK